MALTGDTIKRTTVTTGDDLKTFKDGSDQHYQAIALSDDDGGQVIDDADTARTTATKVLPVQLVGQNGSAPNVDTTSRSVYMIDLAHARAHDGEAYTIKDTTDLSGNAVRDIQITTPNTTKWLHLIVHVSVESETQFFIYENVTINTPGTGLTPINLNRNSANTTGATWAEIDNTSVANANSDTAVAGATIISQQVVGAGKDSGETTHATEFILKQNEDYSIRFVANSAGNVNYHLEWYEHTDLT